MVGSKVAVVVPVYNAGGKLKSCIRSVCRQSLSEICIVLVDDGSTDGSGSICDSFAKKDSRIHVIHQENQGSVKARQNGVFSLPAQEAEYITFCDADDLLPTKALEKMYTAAKMAKADCVCGKMKRTYRGVHVPDKWKAPCFQTNTLTVYEHEAVMKELYVGCFGISNYPVNLCAKLYKTELLSAAIDFEPYVKFMGDDLSVTMEVMPNADRIVIIPEVVYAYNIGGGTSRFMPYMLEDFLALYRRKCFLIEKYEMDESTWKYINIELMNVVHSFLLMCREKGGYDKQALMQETEKICLIPEISSAALAVIQSGHTHRMAGMINRRETEKIVEQIEMYYRNQWKRRLIKKILSK